MEEYRVIKDYENYSVSNLGNVKNNKTGRILKQIVSGSNYLRVNLCKNGNVKHSLIHRLVLLTFKGNNKELEGDHIDNNILNNNLTNLRWCNRSQNNRNKDNFRFKTGSIRKLKTGNRKYNFRYKINTNEKSKSFYTLKEAQMAQKYYKAFIPLIEFGLDK